MPMSPMPKTMIVLVFVILTSLISLTLFLYVVWLVIRALRKYIQSKDASPRDEVVRRSLGEAIKAHRTRLGMTQEFVAERLGVSRQAVSKWEKGQSDPSTANLLSLSQLFGVGAEELLGGSQ